MYYNTKQVWVHICLFKISGYELLNIDIPVSFKTFFLIYLQLLTRQFKEFPIERKLSKKGSACRVSNAVKI